MVELEGRRAMGGLRELLLGRLAWLEVVLVPPAPPAIFANCSGVSCFEVSLMVIYPSGPLRC